MEYARRSGGCLCPSIRTTCRWRQISAKAHTIHVSVIDTCPVSTCATPVSIHKPTKQTNKNPSLVPSFPPDFHRCHSSTTTHDLTQPVAIAHQFSSHPPTGASHHCLASIVLAANAYPFFFFFFSFLFFFFSLSPLILFHWIFNLILTFLVWFLSSCCQFLLSCFVSLNFSSMLVHLILFHEPKPSVFVSKCYSFVYLYGGTFQSDGQPVTGRAVAQGKDLRGKVVLGQLSSFAQIPRAHRVVQSSRPQTGAVGAHIDARGPVRVALELTHQRLIVQIPYGDISVRATAEAHLITFNTHISPPIHHPSTLSNYQTTTIPPTRSLLLPYPSRWIELYLAVGADGQGVTGRCRRSQLCLDPRSRGGQIPNRERASFASYNQSPPIRKQLDTSDVIIPLQTVQLRHRDGRLASVHASVGLSGLSEKLADVPDLNASFATRVNVFGRRGNGHGTDDFSVRKSAQWTCGSRDTGTNQGIGRERNRLDYAISANVEGVSGFASG